MAQVSSKMSTKHHNGPKRGSQERPAATLEDFTMLFSGCRCGSSLAGSDSLVCRRQDVGWSCYFRSTWLAVVAAIPTALEKTMLSIPSAYIMYVYLYQSHSTTFNSIIFTYLPTLLVVETLPRVVLVLRSPLSITAPIIMPRSSSTEPAKATERKRKLPILSLSPR